MKSVKKRAKFAAARFVAVCVGLVALVSPLCGDDLMSAKRDFVKAALSEKVILIRNAGGKNAGELYVFALHFALDNADLFALDPDMTALVREAALGARRALYTPAADALFACAAHYGDTAVRIALYHALADTARGNAAVIDGLNQLLQDQNTAFKAGMTLDYATMEASVAAMGALGDESSYAPLFDAYVLPYPKELTDAARDAMRGIQGDFRAFLAGVIRNGAGEDKVKAFALAMDDPLILAAEKNLLAQTALSIGLSSDDSASYDLRYAAVRALTVLGWSGASDLVIRHFYQVQTDYAAGNVEKARFVEAIKCLGAMRTPEAAQILSIQLGLFNSQTEQNASIDNEIVLAVIHALGGIGDKVAFDHLLYVAFLPYSLDAKTAAKDALAKLRW